MSEQLLSRQRRRELLITLAYSIFTILMIVVSPLEGWPIVYIPLLLAGLILVWWFYVKQFRTYVFRAFVVTAFITANVFLYGIQAEDFFVIIPTLCVEFVLLSLYEMTRLLDIVVLKSFVLLLYHLFVKGYHFPDLRVERSRIILQTLSYLVLMVLCVYRIHHHIQEEQDTENLEEKVLREQRIRNDFVANTSHELRTPVNTISGMCEIMLQKNLPDEIHNGILDIQMTGAELQSIVTDILDYSALEADTMVLQPRIYNITSTLNDVMNTTMYENNSKHLDIIFDCDPNIPSQLEGDEQQLRRVLNTLIGNAIKFTQEGGVTVRVTYRPEAYGINLIVSVKDTGVGLGIEDQELILRGFYQTDSDRNRKSSGLGLGLPITSALIKKMGGFLTINSEEGMGSEFSFAIPQKVIREEPCISLLHPGSIKLIWYYNPQSTVSSIRNSFADHIQHFSDYFGILSYRATTLEECKRLVASQGQGVHLILGQSEYLANKAYFDELSEKTSIILVAERNAVPNAGPRIHVLYKPYNAIMLAEILNGEFRNSKTKGRKELKKFIAPTAKILVVDDNLMNLKVVEGLLRKYRIRVVTATSGEEALSLIESQDYDFVFMDHMMPGMDGVECYHRIREKQGAYYSQVPVIALTANAIAGSREMFLSEGFSEFVAKPIDTTLLNEVLYRFIPFEKHLTEEDIRYLTENESAGLPDKKEKAKPQAQKAEDKAPAAPLEPVQPAALTTEIIPDPAALPTDPFESLPFIDKGTALTYCGSTEDFLELVQLYFSSGQQYKEDLQSALDTMDLKSYALLAHTVKGTSRTLGILPLADKAFSLEMAAKESREADIRELHDAFLEEYGSVLNAMGKLFEKNTAEEAAVLSPSEQKEIADWDGLKTRLAQCLESYEEKAFDDALEEVKGQTLKGRPIEIVLADVLDKVAAFDFEGALEQLKEIGGAAC